MQRVLHTTFFFIFRSRAVIKKLTTVILVSVIPCALFVLVVYLLSVLSKKDFVGINTY